MDILKEEAKEATNTILTVVKKLGLLLKNFDLVLVGGVFKCEKYFKENIINNIKGKCPNVNFKSLTNKPVEGVIKLAIKNM